MGKATGIFLILAGVGTAALVLPKVDTEAERQLADVVRIATGVTGSAPAPVATPAPASARLKTAALNGPTAASISEPEGASRIEQARVDQAASNRAAPLTQKEAAATAVPPVLVAPPQIVVRNAAPMHTDDAQGRQTLARDIQKELKRVGCYDGEITGEWSAATKRAMGQFITRLNAALPSDEPDHILRAMVQGYPGKACGRATPSAIVAQSGTAKKSADQPTPRDIATVRPTVPKPAWETSVAAATTRPANVSPSAPVTSEGRMAMGGPVAIAPAPGVTGSIHTPELKAIIPSSGNESVAMPSVAMTGTIAALSGAGAPTMIPPEQGVSAAASSRADDLAAAERRARQRERERRQAAEYTPFPQAYRLGATEPKYVATGQYRERTTFTQRFFDRQKTGFDAR